MPTPREIVQSHLRAMFAQAAEAGVPAELVGRALLDAAAEILVRECGAAQAAQELTFVAGNLGDDEDYAFMRP